jgi:hypothetical protein
MRILSFTIIFVATIFFIAFFTGYIINPNYESETKVLLGYSKSSVWNALNDIENLHHAKKDVISIDVLGKYLNFYAWVENLKNDGFRRYRQVYKDTNSKLIIEMTDSSYGLTGTWEFDLKESDGDTLLTIKQKTTNESIIGRGFRYYFGRDKETKEWIKHLRVTLFERLLTTP